MLGVCDQVFAVALHPIRSRISLSVQRSNDMMFVVVIRSVITLLNVAPHQRLQGHAATRPTEAVPNTSKSVERNTITSGIGAYQSHGFCFAVCVLLVHDASIFFCSEPAETTTAESVRACSEPG